MVKKISAVPEGVKILATLLFVGALVSVAIGGFMFAFSDGIRNMDPTLLSASGLTETSPGMIVLFGVLLVAIGIFEYFVGRDLLRARNWARIVLGVFAVLGIVMAILNFSAAMYASATFSLVIQGTIVWYLFVKKETKKFFK